MSNNTTLVSIAMLKVQIDSQKDYLDYLVPFVIDVLSLKKPEVINEEITKKLLKTEFGLNIPERTIQIILKRLAKKSYIMKQHGVYVFAEKFPESNLQNERANAQRHINSVILDIKNFWKSYEKKDLEEEQIVRSLLAVLSDFTTPALSAYLKGTVIPDEIVTTSENHIMIGKYILHIYKSSPNKLDSFILLLKGHMIANAILCPDLQDVKNNYKNLTFYLDTPLVIQLLGFEGIFKKEAIEELVKLLKKLKAEIAIFEHTYDEVHDVLERSADYIDKNDGRGPIVIEARKNKTKKSDILLFLADLKDSIVEKGISIKKTPSHTSTFQINEDAFENTLDNTLSYRNKNAKSKDIESVRSIYELRKGDYPRSLEDSKAVLVTSNTQFSKAAYEFGKRYQEAEKVSSVITDFSLANIAWLKAPGGALSLPEKEILAYSYASMCPSNNMLNKFLEEVEKLKNSNLISERHHQILISSSITSDELMTMTLGNEDALNGETILELANRVENEIKKEELEKLDAEKNAHESTRMENKAFVDNRKNQAEKAYWKCKKNSDKFEKSLIAILFILLLSGILFGVGFRNSNIFLSYGLIIGFAVMNILSIFNILIGTTIKEITARISKRYLNLCIRKEEKYLGFSILEYYKGRN